MSQDVLPQLADPGKPTPPITTKEKLDLVQRIVRNPIFARSTAMRAFLLYITENELANRQDLIKEQAIGVTVLGRNPNYDPSVDNIVRVRAHELRQRLEKYFTTDGAGEHIVLTIPKGTYRPDFALRPGPAPTPGPAPELPAIPQPTEAKPSAEIPQPAKAAASPRRYWFWVSVSLVANLILIAAVVVLLRKPAVKADDPLTSPPFRDFWLQVFRGSDHDLKIIPADTGFALWQDLSGHNVNLGDYLSRHFLSLADGRLREVAMRRSTSPADVVVSTRLALITRAFGGQSVLQYARDLDARSFQNGNVAILGSHRSNPWVEVFEPQLNFVLDRDPSTGSPSLLNRAPRSGELPRYSIPTTLDVEGGEQKEFRSYGLVALLHPCNSPHFAVLIEGLNMQATEAAGELVTDAHGLKSLLQAIHHQPGTDVTPFEALIQIKSLPGGYADTQVIAYRDQTAAPCTSASTE
jgi:hypothetical protein